MDEKSEGTTDDEVGSVRRRLFRCSGLRGVGSIVQADIRRRSL